MSTRVAWLSVGTLTYGWLVVGCTGADETAVFTDPSVTSGGRNAALGGSQQAGNSAKAGDKGSGGSSSHQAGASNGGAPTGGGVSSGAGSSGDTGQSGSAGDGSIGGLPGNGGGGSGQAGSGNAGQPGGAGQPGSAGQAGSGGQSGGGLNCSSTAECLVHNQYCLKPACGASQGVCTDVVAGVPLCGCDGVTYYDGSLAIGAGRSIEGSGVCSGPGTVACQEGQCDDDLTCGRVVLRGDDCPIFLPGVCWALPALCPVNQPAPFNLCGTGKCTGLCDAVRSGKVSIGNPLQCAN